MNPRLIQLAKLTLSDSIVYWRMIIVALTPLLLIIIPVCWQTEPSSISLCAYVVIVMAIYWVAEAIPITVTAFIPLFAFPLLGIQPAKVVALSYVPDISFLFIGGLIVAVAVEEVNLHRRIALLILLGMGSQPRWLLLGIMIATALLSMFISNTATTAMMTPIVLTLAREMILTSRQTDARNARNISPKLHEDTIVPVSDPNSIYVEEGSAAISLPHSPLHGVDSLNNSELRLLKLLLLATCYSASIGGTSTLTGTGPNLVMVQLLSDRFPEHPVNYASWFGYNGLGMIINIFMAWIWLQLAMFGPKQLLLCKSKVNSGIRDVIRAQLQKMGRPKWSEVSVIVMFLVLFLLWLIRKPAWGLLFKFGTSKQFPSDATSAMLVSFLLFLWPLECPDFWCCKSRDRAAKPRIRRSILTWDIVERKFPWGIVFLLGGGFALGKGVESSGLSKLVGESLTALKVTNLQLCVISLVLMTYMTEFTSNTATSNILLPIVMTVAKARCINPLYLTLPVTEAASFAFMLPVATPPNAIVFRAGVLRVRDMIWIGFVMNMLCMCEVMLSIHTWGFSMFHLESWPDWAGNNTACHSGFNQSLVE